MVVRVGLVGLEHRELGVVLVRDALVAEVLAELVDLLEAADDQPLQVELGRDPQVERAVERVVVGGERPRERAAVERLQHRRLDLQEAALVEEAAHRRDQPACAARTARAPPRWRSGRARGGGSAVSTSASPWYLSGGGRSDFASSVHASTRSDSSPRRVRNGAPSTPIRSPRSSVDQPLVGVARARPCARAAGSARSGPRGRGTRPCRGRAARVSRPASRTVSSVSSPSCERRRSARAPRRSACGPGSSCGNGSTPAARSSLELAPALGEQRDLSSAGGCLGWRLKAPGAAIRRRRSATDCRRSGRFGPPTGDVGYAVRPATPLRSS